MIRLDDVHAVKLPEFNEVKSNLEQRMQEPAFEKVVAELRAKAKIE